MIKIAFYDDENLDIECIDGDDYKIVLKKRLSLEEIKHSILIRSAIAQELNDVNSVLDE